MTTALDQPDPQTPLDFNAVLVARMDQLLVSNSQLNEAVAGLSAEVRDMNDVRRGLISLEGKSVKNARRLLAITLVAFTISMTVLGITYGISRSDRDKLREQAAESKRACQTTVEVSRQTIASYDILLADPAVTQDPGNVKLIMTIRAAAVQRANVKC